MMKKFYLVFIFLVSIIHTSAADFLDDACTPFIRVDPTVALDKYPVAIPLKGGPLRVLFIGQRDTVGRLSVSVAARLDCRFEAVLTENRKKLGIPANEMNSKSPVLSQEAVEKRAGQLFREEWDVIWLDFEFGALPEGFRLTLIDRLEKGTGLVYVGESREIEKIGASGKLDDARLKAVSFGKNRPECIGMRKQGIVTVLPPLDRNGSFRDRGDFLTLAINTIMFASGRDNGLMITKIPDPGKTIEQESVAIMNYRIYFFNSGETKPMRIIGRYRDETGEQIEETNTVYKVENGRSYVIVEYPFLPVGSYSLDISVSDDDGVVALGGTSISVTGQKYITDLEFWEMSAPEGGLIIGKLKVSTKFTDAMSVRFDLLDCRRRLIGRNEPVPDLNLKNVDFVFKVGHINERIMYVRAYLVHSNKTVQMVEKPVYISRLHDPRRFSLVVCDNRASESTSVERYTVLRDAGVTMLDIDMTALHDMDSIFRAASHAASGGMGIIPRITRIASSSSGPVMEPVMTTVDFYETLEKRIRAVADTLRHFSPPAYSIGRDNMLTGYDVDVSFSQTDSESFRNYLQNRYTSVENVNKAWGSAYPSFTDIQPVPFAQARKTGEYAVWLDTRLHMEDVFTQAHNGAFEAFNSAENGMKVGIEGFGNSWSPFRGYNLFDLTGFLTLAVSGQETGAGYPGDVSVSAALESFIQRDSMTGLLAGGEMYPLGSEELLRAAPWQSLFLGMNSVWWNSAFGGIDAALTPQYTLSPAFSVLAGEAREIMSGIDLLLYGSTRLVDTVGILYSPLSRMAAYTSAQQVSSEGSLTDGKGITGSSTDTVPSVSKSVRSFYLACQDAGFTPMFISEDQLTEEWLAEEKFDILILPYNQSMGDETAQVLRKFVLNGGTLIADMRPGVMNDHLFMREKGALDDVFGVAQGTDRTVSLAPGTFEPLQVDGGFLPEHTFENCLSDPTIRALEGVHVLARSGKTPAVIVNRYGNGNGIFLNMWMGMYENMRMENHEKVFRDIVSWCLYTGGAGKPYISVRDSSEALARKISATVFRDDQIEYVGILPDPGMTAEYYLRDGYYLDLSQIGKSYFVYDVRSGAFLGANQRISVTPAPGKAELYALLPYRVKDIELRLKTPVVQAGGTLEYTAAVIPQGINMKPGRHVFLITVKGPDGSIQPFFSESRESVNGILQSSLNISIGDQPGRWVLEVKDITTGKTAEKGFMVMTTGRMLPK
ncbi:beta-galactosidase [bacterium]|nr:beta-galactosidase [bacterium]